MDSETKPGRTRKEDAPSLLSFIRERLRPVLLKKWRVTRATALASAATEGLTETERDLFLAGHQAGYWQGAVDSATIKPKDLRRVPQDPQDPGSKIH